MEVVVIIGWLKVLSLIGGLCVAILTICNHMKNLVLPLKTKLDEAHLISVNNSQKIDDIVEKLDNLAERQKEHLGNIKERIATIEGRLG